MEKLRVLVIILLAIGQAIFAGLGVEAISNQAPTLSVKTMVIGAVIGFISLVMVEKFWRTKKELFAELTGSTRYTQFRGLLKLVAILGAFALNLATNVAGLRFVGAPKGWSILGSFILPFLNFLLIDEKEKGAIQKLEKLCAWMIFTIQAGTTGYSIYAFCGFPQNTTVLWILLSIGGSMSVGINLLERKYFNQADEIVKNIDRDSKVHFALDIIYFVIIPVGIIIIEVGTSIVGFVALGVAAWLSWLISVSLTPAFEYLHEDTE